MKKIINSLVAVLMVVSPVFAGAEMVGSFTRDLEMGATGNDVVTLQTYLEGQGFLIMPADAAKGYFGQLTLNALMRWQANNDLPTTGYFGPLSRNTLAQGAALAVAPVQIPTRGAVLGVSTSCIVIATNFGIGATDVDTNGEVTKVQQYLETQGYSFPDKGTFGSKTETTLRQWQTANNLPVSGSVDKFTRVFIAKNCPI